MDYLQNLNKEQLEAVKHVDGPCLVMAGAGSGKTKVLTSRIAHLIDIGVKPYNILAITFTNKAAREMKERVIKTSGNVNSFIGTFHSFGLKIIRENPEKVGLTQNFSIIDSDDSVSIIKKILKKKNLDSKKFNPNYIKNRISFIKNEMLSMNEIERTMNTPIDKVVIDIYKIYEDTLFKSNAVDFDDLLLKPVRLFMEDETVLERYQNHYPYILIDEYQDTNPVQYKLSKLLSSKYKNIFVVGDMNQSIYGFRYADYRNIMYFEQDYDDVKVIKLEQNYRSTQVILDAANCVIKNNSNKKDMKLWSDKTNDYLVNYIRAYDEMYEVKLIIDEIKKLKNSYESFNSFAVLYRTNAQSRIIEETFLEYGIPYKVFGGFSYINRKEIKDLIAYLKFINNTNDEISLRRIINTPKRGIGPAALDRMERESILNNNSMFDNLSKKNELEFKESIESMIKYKDEHTLTDIVDYVIEKSGMKDMYADTSSIENGTRLENLYEFKSLTEGYSYRTGNENLSDFLAEISLMTDNNERNDLDEYVTLMTLHSAKGLEFDVVFLVGLEEGIFPHVNSINEPDGIDEERRLCYVGITRARDILYISNAKRRLLFGQDTYNSPSRFIDEIDENLINTNHLASADTTVRQNFYTNANDDLKMGDLINHAKFGHGVIINMKDDLIDVAFKDGVRKMKKEHKDISKL